METIGYRGLITIDRGRVILHRNAGGEVWLAQPEIARLFGVFEAAVRANIRAIYRSEALRRGPTQRIVHGVEFYNLEMIAALAFRLRSLESEAFRRWLLHPAAPHLRLVSFPTRPRPPTDRSGRDDHDEPSSRPAAGARSRKRPSLPFHRPAAPPGPAAGLAHTLTTPQRTLSFQLKAASVRICKAVLRPVSKLPKRQKIA